MIKYLLFFVLGLLSCLRPAFAQNDTFYLMFGSGYTFEREVHGYLETERNDVITRRGSNKDSIFFMDFGFYGRGAGQSLLGLTWTPSTYAAGELNDSTTIEIETHQLHVSYLYFFSNLPPQSFYIKTEIGSAHTSLLKKINGENVAGRGAQWGPSGKLGIGFSLYTPKASGVSFLAGVNYHIASADTMGTLAWASAELAVLW